MKHTPGPWFVRNDREFYVDHPQPFCIATSPEGEEDHDTLWLVRCMDAWDEEMLANARLIAAAPDLLDTLKWIVEHGGRDYEIGQRAKKAIRKATGE